MPLSRTLHQTSNCAGVWVPVVCSGPGICSGSVLSTASSAIIPQSLPFGTRTDSSPACKRPDAVAERSTGIEQRRSGYRRGERLFEATGVARRASWAGSKIDSASKRIRASGLENRRPPPLYARSNRRPSRCTRRNLNASVADLWHSQSGRDELGEPVAARAMGGIGDLQFARDHAGLHRKGSAEHAC